MLPEEDCKIYMFSKDVFIYEYSSLCQEKEGRKEGKEKREIWRKGEVSCLLLTFKLIIFHLLIIKSSRFHFHFNHFSYLPLKQKQPQFYYLP